MRRFLQICALAICACMNPPATAAASNTSLSSSENTTTDAFRQKLDVMKPEIVENGVSEKFAAAALAGLEPDLDVIRLSQSQPEHTRTIGDYISAIVSESRIETGKAKLTAHTGTLVRLEKKYGIPRQILVAIWGIESRYGENKGTRAVVRSLATLAVYDKRRENFWKRQLIAALRISERGDIAHNAMTGSWAGAMGHTQFIPTTFEAFGEDFDGDGTANIWSSHDDALASAAHYLQQSGWQRLPENVSPWGYEVMLPNGFDYSAASLSTLKTGQEWTHAGVRCAKGGSIPPNVDFSLILPQGASGPTFLVTPNFKVILRYNNSRSYALAVAHLADRITGARSFMRPWLDVKPLTRSQRMALQEVLVARGYDTGGIDGILGNKSARAIRSEQTKLGLPADGFASIKILKALQHNGFPHVGETE